MHWLSYDHLYSQPGLEDHTGLLMHHTLTFLEQTMTLEILFDDVFQVVLSGCIMAVLVKCLWTAYKDF